MTTRERSDRIERALSQRLFLVGTSCDDALKTWSFEVLGSTGDTVYEVRLGRRRWSCSCPDFTQRAVVCKHIYVVVLRVLGVQRDVLDVVLNNMEIAQQTCQLSGERISLAHSRNMANLEHALQQRDESEAREGKEPMPMDGKAQRKIEPEDDCAICYEKLLDKTELVFCASSCGQSVHKQCFVRWATVRGKTCVYCRAEMGLRPRRERSLSPAARRGARSRSRSRSR
jgi:hypothetical protein